MTKKYKRLTSDEVVDNLELLNRTGLRQDFAAHFIQFIANLAESEGIPAIDLLSTFYNCLSKIGEVYAYDIKHLPPGTDR